jgi:hypothetical protein
LKTGIKQPNSGEDFALIVVVVVIVVLAAVIQKFERNADKLHRGMIPIIFFLLRVRADVRRNPGAFCKHPESKTKNEKTKKFQNRPVSVFLAASREASEQVSHMRLDSVLVHISRVILITYACFF